MVLVLISISFVRLDGAHVGLHLLPESRDLHIIGQPVMFLIWLLLNRQDRLNLFQLLVKYDSWQTWTLHSDRLQRLGTVKFFVRIIQEKAFNTFSGLLVALTVQAMQLHGHFSATLGHLADDLYPHLWLHHW